MSSGESSSSRPMHSDDKEAMVEMSLQVQNLFHRLDIPIQSIPLGSSLPWKSFESLIVNHAVRKRSKPADAVPTSSSAPVATGAAERSHSLAARNTLVQPQRGGPLAPNPTSGGRRSLSPINLRPSRLSSSATAGREHASRDLQPSPRQGNSSRKRGGTVTLDGAETPFGRNNGPSHAASAFDPALHSLSLMLVNDATHIPTMDSTLHDMQVAIRRMDGITTALSAGQPFRPRSETAIEPGVIYDPELRTIAELQRTVEILRSDVATHAATIRRLDGELADKKLLIAQLREDLSFYRSKDPFSGDDLDDASGGASREVDDDAVEVISRPRARAAPVSAFTAVEDDDHGASGGAEVETTPESPSVLEGSSSAARTVASVSEFPQGAVPESSGVTFASIPDESAHARDATTSNKTDGGALRSVRDRFKSAVSKIPRKIDGEGVRPTASAVLGPPSLLRNRFSITAIAAFREAVMDTIARRHIVLGLDMFETIKKAAMTEAAMMNRMVAESARDAPGTLQSVASFRGSGNNASRAFPTATRSQHAFCHDDGTSLEDAENFFAVASLRLLDAPSYGGPRAHPFAKDLFFLAFAISHKTVLGEAFDPTVWSSATQQALFYAESVVKEYGGHVVTNEHQEYLIVFDCPRRMLLCALEIQYVLPNTPTITWPSELESNPLTASTRDLQSTAKRYVWRGVRLGMCIDVVPSGSATCLRDICDKGGVIYNGFAVRSCLWIAAHVAQGGSVVLQDRMRRYVEEQAVELDDPTVAFWSWRYLPGATAPTKLYDCYHRCHTTRRAENQHSMRLLYDPLQLRILTDAKSPATLERLVTLHNQAAAKQGIKPVTRDDESILGLEGTVEQRLAKLRELPMATGDDYRPAHETLFLAHVPPLPSPPQPEDFQKLPTGDICIILITIPAYDDIVCFVDDALASSYARKIFRTCRELALRSEFGSIAAIRNRRDRLMLATSEPMDAIKFALLLQDQLFHLSPWSRDGGLPPGLVALLEPKKVRGKVVAEGPAVHCSLHFSKVKTSLEPFGAQQAYYIGTELDILEHLTFNAPEHVNSILLSDTMFAILHARENELTLPQPFVECIGLMDRQGELRCVYNMTPRFLVSRQLLYPSACWYSFRRWVARQRVIDANSGVSAARRGSTGSSSNTPGSGVEFGVVRFAPPRLVPSEQRAMRRYYDAADKTHRARQLVPSYAALAQSNTITSTKMQTMCAKMFFDMNRREHKVKSILSAAVSLAVHRGRPEDAAMAATAERAAMELHDALMPIPTILGRGKAADCDFLVLQELGGAGGGTASGSAFIAMHGSAASSTSTPKSSNLLNRSGSSRGGTADPARRLHHPPLLNLVGGPVPDHRGAYVEEMSNAEGSHQDNHEVKALFEIDKERQFMAQRSKKVEAEVRITHQALECFVHTMEAYLGQLLSTQVHRMSDEEVIVKFMKRINTLRDVARKTTDDSDDDDEELGDDPGRPGAGDKSSSDDESETKRSQAEEAAYQQKLEKIRVNERWQDALASVVQLEGSDSSDYDPVLLCRSMVGQLCRHFLSMRTVSRRMLRMTDALERAQRTMDPHTRIGKAVEQASERDLERREEEAAASQLRAAEVVELGAIEETDIVLAATSSSGPRKNTNELPVDDEEEV